MNFIVRGTQISVHVVARQEADTWALEVGVMFRLRHVFCGSFRGLAWFPFAVPLLRPFIRWKDLIDRFVRTVGFWASWKSRGTFVECFSWFIYPLAFAGLLLICTAVSEAEVILLGSRSYGDRRYSQRWEIFSQFYLNIKPSAPISRFVPLSKHVPCACQGFRCSLQEHRR